MISRPENGSDEFCPQVCSNAVAQDLITWLSHLSSPVSQKDALILHDVAQGLPPALSPTVGLPTSPSRLFSGPTSSGPTPQAHLALLRFFAFPHSLCSFPCYLPNQLCHPVPCAHATSCMEPLPVSSSTSWPPYICSLSTKFMFWTSTLWSTGQIWPTVRFHMAPQAKNSFYIFKNLEGKKSKEEQYFVAHDNYFEYKYQRT